MILELILGWEAVNRMGTSGGSLTTALKLRVMKSVQPIRRSYQGTRPVHVMQLFDLCPTGYRSRPPPLIRPSTALLTCNVMSTHNLITDTVLLNKQQN
jgi:hypothetical protein